MTDGIDDSGKELGPNETAEVAAILFLYLRGVSPAEIARVRRKQVEDVLRLIAGALEYALQQLGDARLIKALTTLYAGSQAGLTPRQIAQKYELDEEMEVLIESLVGFLDDFLRSYRAG